MIRSFRAQLTVWNVVVIAVSLTVFAFATIYANEIRMRRDIDRELVDRAHRAPPEGPAASYGAKPTAANEGFVDIRRPRRFDRSGSRLGPSREGPFDISALRGALAGTAAFTNGVYRGEKIRIYTAPDKDGGAIQVAVETRDLDQIWRVQSVNLIWLLPVALAVAGFGAFFLTRRATTPLHALKQAASSITDEDLSQRLEIKGNDEFAELAATFNDMISRLDRSFTNVREAYELQKRFNADVSHELRTPLTRMRLATSGALEPGSTSEEMLKALKVADDSGQMMSRMIQKMLILANADAGQLRLNREPIDLRVLANEVSESLEPPAERLRAEYCDDAATVNGDLDYLVQATANLIENALKYSAPDGVVTISVRKEEGCAVLQVSDTGKGVPAELLPHLGERFFRADPNRSGSQPGNGLGLAICRTLVEAHGGSLSFESSPGTGFSAKAAIPLASK